MFDAATVKLPAAVKSSLIVATGEAEPALPCCRVTAADGVIVGAPLTVKVNEAVAVAPQLSVAVTVTVYAPDGPALVMDTRPAALTLKLPVKPPDAATVTLLIAPLSRGAAVGVTVAAPPGLNNVAA